MTPPDPRQIDAPERDHAMDELPPAPKLCGAVMATCRNEPEHPGDHWNPEVAEPEPRIDVLGEAGRWGSLMRAADGRWYVGTADLGEHPTFGTASGALAYLLDRHTFPLR